MAAFTGVTLDLNNVLIAEVRSGLDSEISGVLEDLDIQRFLTSNSNSVTKSLDQIKAWYTWWTTPLLGEESRGVTPGNILQHEDKNQELVRKYMLHSFQGVDHEGRPVYWEKQGYLSQRITEAKKAGLTSDIMFQLHVRHEALLELCCAHQSKKCGRYIGKHVKVADVKGLGMIPDSVELDYVRRMVQADEKYYPGRIETLVFINAPWYFSTVFALISPLMSASTLKKVKVLGTNFLGPLSEMIPLDQIPEYLGGTHKEYVWQQPFPSETGVSPQQVKEFLSGTSE